MRGDKTLFRRALLAADTALVAAAYVITLHTRQAWAQAEGLLPEFLDIPAVASYDVEAYYQLGAAMLLVWGVSLFATGTFDFRISYPRVIARYAQAMAISVAVMVLAAFVFKLHFVARSFTFSFGIVAFVFLSFTRFLTMEALAFMRRKRVDGHRVLIVGGDAHARSVARALRAAPPWDSKVVGFVTPTDDRLEVPPELWMGRAETLAEFLDVQPVDQVIFIAQLEEPVLSIALNACSERGVGVSFPLPRALPPGATIELAAMPGMDAPLLTIRRTPSDDVRLAAKRAMDIVGSLIGILLSSPLMLAAAIAIKLTSPGPILFRQIRSGKNGRKFGMLKFRSMVANAEALRPSLQAQNEMSGPVFKMSRDPRVTRVGDFIRRTSIDELPQLFNILNGDMSLVGPRPPIPSEVEQYEPWQRRRLSVKPGLTGLWQVSGRNDIDFEEWMRLDLRYIDTWSLWLDFKIILKTLPAVLNKTGAR